MRSRFYYLFDKETNKNVSKYDTLFDAQLEKKKRNEKEGKQRFECKGSWVINKLQ